MTKERLVTKMPNIGLYCKPCKVLIKDADFCLKCEWKCRCGTYNKFTVDGNTPYQ